MVYQSFRAVFCHTFVCRDEDDINDVASMAGVNLSEESANILATNSRLVGVVTHSCKDEAFLSFSVLQKTMQEIGEMLLAFLTIRHPSIYSSTFLLQVGGTV